MSPSRPEDRSRRVCVWSKPIVLGTESSTRDDFDTAKLGLTAQLAKPCVQQGEPRDAVAVGPCVMFSLCSLLHKTYFMLSRICSRTNVSLSASGQPRARDDASPAPGVAVIASPVAAGMLENRGSHFPSPRDD